ncbi:hypothetical protein RIF29_18655 [Crotalaria pallida]|uniref:Uncharacterized protein n=1 Tax=Crotalaria pallida TaxID=3830 RepID=A0AAN9EZ99_CROPI
MNKREYCLSDDVQDRLDSILVRWVISSVAKRVMQMDLGRKNESRILNTKAKSVIDDDKLNKGEVRLRQVCLSGSSDQMVVGTKVKFVDKSQQSKKNRRNIASHQVSHGIGSHEEKVYKSKQENELSLQKSSKVTSTHTKEKVWRSGSQVSTDKMVITTEHPVQELANGDVAMLMRNSIDTGSNVGVNYNSENFPNQQLTVSNPMQTNSSQTAFNMLEEAAKLKDRADKYN